MAELTLSPAFGNPRLARQGQKARELAARNIGLGGDNSALGHFFGGVFGDSELESPPSVLDPNFEGKNAARKAGYLIQLLTMASPAGLVGGKGVNAAKTLTPPRLGANQRGAVSIGGAKDLIAAHAFAPSREVAQGIVKEGGLLAPSIGITSRQGPHYGSHQPAFIFRAGVIDPTRRPGSLINRDGYFANPMGWKYTGSGMKKSFDPELLQRQIADYQKDARNRYGFDDMRLQQMVPSEPGQLLTIGASPRFGSMKEFEKSPYGAQTLRHSREDRRARWKQLSDDLLELTPGGGEPGNTWKLQSTAVDLIKSMYKDPDMVKREAKHLWEDARRSPSHMAEFKLHQKLPLTPGDAFVLLPPGVLSSRPQHWMDVLEPLRDAGFRFALPQDVMAMAPISEPSNAIGKGLMKTVPNTGELRPPLLGSGVEHPFGAYGAGTRDFMDWAAGGPLGDAVLDPKIRGFNIGPPKRLFAQEQKRLQDLEYQKMLSEPEEVLKPSGVGQPAGGAGSSLPLEPTWLHHEQPLWQSNFKKLQEANPEVVKWFEDNADEYLDVAVQAVQMGKNPAKTLSKLKEFYDVELHGFGDNWHQVVLDNLIAHVK